MPTDIRSFFGGKDTQSSATPVKRQDTSNTRKRRNRKIVDDSDDDEALQHKSPSPKAVKPAKREVGALTKGEPTTTSDYFASSKKRETPPNAQNTTRNDHQLASSPGDGRSETVSANVKRSRETPHTRSARNESAPAMKAKAPSSKTQLIVDDNLGGDDIFATEYGKPGKADDGYVEEEDGNEADQLPMEDAPQVKSRNGRKRKSDMLLDKDESSEPDNKISSVSKSLAVRTPKKPRAAPKNDKPESKEIQKIFDSIPTVRPPTPPEASGGPKKFNYAQQAQRSRTPVGGGTKDVPVGADNCLAGLSFVFTGILDSIGREEGQSLVKRYGGKVTGAPSSKTSYVVLGSDAGPKKLENIRKHKIKTINEDGLFELIRQLPANGGDGKAAEQYQAKKMAEEDKIRAMAAEIDREEKKAMKNLPKVDSTAIKSSQTSSISVASSVDGRLWTTKYAPTSLGMLCGNKGAVEKLQEWLRNWRRNAKLNFARPGKDGSGKYRAVIIHGPPGIGKTTAAHLVAKAEGYDVVETNASDARSKKLVENGLLGVLDTTSLQGYFSGEGKKIQSEKKNLVLIMDEVDGMSAGDRGGVGALAAIARKTRVPMILICNDRRLPKMKPFDHVTYELPFRRPTSEQIRARLSTICYREGLKIPPQVLDRLIEGTHADIRQVVNMLSTVKLGDQGLDFEQGMEMSKAWEKHVILKPWDIVGQILRAQMFSPSSNTSLNDKIELYFNDHEFSYLMLQENYLKTSPTLAGNLQGRERQLKLLELADNAASSISDGDLVDRMIHGTQQQWSLMPIHAAFSFVRPASFTFGNMIDRPGFTSWLGHNSKHGKLGRYVKEIQGHMRLRASGDREEIRQQYFPVLWNRLVRRLMEEGKDSVEDIINLMDSYFLTREDWDAIVELGLGPMDESQVKIESQAKATFTRLYNQQSHPLPFAKASDVVATKGLRRDKPDIEDAIEESDEEEVLGDEVKDDEEPDLKKDKYVKLPKKPAAQKGNAGKGKRATKGKKNEEDDFIDDDEGDDARPRKGRGRKLKAKA
ncbi:Replication factor RFC1 C terminal domain containing protein [Elaphomyces granulatus]